MPSDDLPAPTLVANDVAVGEAAAHARWRAFREGALTAYGTDRDRPDLDGTSRLSQALKYLSLIHIYVYKRQV